MLKIEVVATTAQIPSIYSIEETLDEGETLCFIDDSTGKIYCFTLDSFDGEIIQKVLDQNISISSLIDSTIIED
jgi:hypothetical protein